MQRVLVVDDDRVISDFMKDLLLEKGHEVMTAKDGLSALDVLESFKPDVIFIDLVMPNIDGKRLCRIIRGMREFKNTYIVILSAIAAEQETDITEFGANVCIAKGPFSELSQHVLSVLDQTSSPARPLSTKSVIGVQNMYPRRIAEELLSVKRHFEIILDRMSEGILETTGEGRIVYANPTALQMTGIAEEKLLGSSFLNLFAVEDRVLVDEILRKADSEPKKMNENSAVWLNNRQVSMNCLNLNGEGATSIIIVNDVTERNRAEEMLRSERDKFQGVLYAIGEGMYIVNDDFVIEYQNEVQERLYPGSIGKKCYSAYMHYESPCNFCRMHRATETTETQSIEALGQYGRSFDMVFSPFADADGRFKVIVLRRDVTEKKRVQGEAMRIGHLASLGELSAGVAHEINNPINGIINYAQILKDQSSESGDNAEIPERIIKEGERIAQIVKNLLSFASDRKGDFSPSSAKNIVADSLDLVNKQMEKDGIKVVLDMPQDLPMIRARSSEIQQVFLNLLSNARYALNKRFKAFHEDKTLEIKGRLTEFDGRPHVQITFCDRGTGIPSDLLDKVCNPFFSTKPKGEGTGLGLSISHGLIQRHSGKLSFQSVEGRYTKAIVELPVYD